MNLPLCEVVVGLTTDCDAACSSQIAVKQLPVQHPFSMGSYMMAMADRKATQTALNSLCFADGQE